MRSRLPWLIGLAGLLALLRKRRHRVAVVEPGDPAADLRRKLDETLAEPPAEEHASAEPPAQLDVRRRQVHDAARAAADEMRGPAPPEA